MAKGEVLKRKRGGKEKSERIDNKPCELNIDHHCGGRAFH